MRAVQTERQRVVRAREAEVVEAGSPSLKEAEEARVQACHPMMEAEAVGACHLRLSEASLRCHCLPNRLHCRSSRHSGTLDLRTHLAALSLLSSPLTIPFTLLLSLTRRILATALIHIGRRRRRRPCATHSRRTC